MIPRINLLTLDVPIRSPLGIVYSTNPMRAEGENEVSYFTKGPELEIVFAEIAGCALAREVGLIVPDVAACVWDGQVRGGAALVEADRDAGHWIGRPQRVSNFGDLFNAVIVDIWLANIDRNMGNVLAKPRGDGHIEFVFIDFEKSTALRPQPRINSTMLEPRQLWPTGELGLELSAIRPLHPPQTMLTNIHSLAPDRCEQIILEVVAAVGPVPWADDAVHALLNRADQIQRLTEEVWQVIP